MEGEQIGLTGIVGWTRPDGGRNLALREAWGCLSPLVSRCIFHWILMEQGCPWDGYTRLGF